jgi:hypothetical protein
MRLSRPAHTGAPPLLWITQCVGVDANTRAHVCITLANALARNTGARIGPAEL